MRTPSLLVRTPLACAALVATLLAAGPAVAAPAPLPSARVGSSTATVAADGRRSAAWRVARRGPWRRSALLERPQGVAAVSVLLSGAPQRVALAVSVDGRSFRAAGTLSAGAGAWRPLTLTVPGVRAIRISGVARSARSQLVRLRITPSASAPATPAAATPAAGAAAPARTPAATVPAAPVATATTPDPPAPSTPTATTPDPPATTTTTTTTPGPPPTTTTPTTTPRTAARPPAPPPRPPRPPAPSPVSWTIPSTPPS